MSTTLFLEITGTALVIACIWEGIACLMRRRRPTGLIQLRRRP
jgi:hypothetical protein